MKTRLTLLLAFVSATAFAAPQPGDPAPNFSLTDVNGQSHSLADYKGKYVVLEWNNPGCPFVHKHYDSGNMQNLQKQAESRGVIWLTVNSGAAGRQGATTNEIKGFLSSEHAAPTAYLIDSEGKVGRLYGARTTPDMYIIGPNGKLIYDGAIDNKPTPDPEDIPGATNYVKAALEESMAGKPVEVTTSKPYGCSVKYGGTD
jgi:hypothetical protein